MSAMPQLSPNALIGNPTYLNPLAHSTYNLSAAAAGSLVQHKIARDKSDSVNISRQAMEKAAQAESQDGMAKQAQTREAPDKAKGA
jgi:hypothetical protein